MKTLFLILLIPCVTLKGWSVTWWPDYVQICRPTAWDVTLTCKDYTYSQALSALAANWLKPDGDMNFIGALYPDVKSGCVNMKDFNELAKHWPGVK